METCPEYFKSEPVEHLEGWSSEEQRFLLGRLFQIDTISHNFFLTGGTALSSFYLGHQQSIDIDLFTTQETISLMSLAPLFRNTIFPQKIFTQNDHFLSYLSEKGVKVDIVVDYLSDPSPRPRILMKNIPSTIVVDSFQNIAVKKICALINRTDEKDVIDVMTIIHQAPVVEKEPALLWLMKEAGKREALAADLIYLTELISSLTDIFQKKESFNFTDEFLLFEKTIAFLQKTINNPFRQE